MKIILPRLENCKRHIVTRIDDEFVVESLDDIIAFLKEASTLGEYEEYTEVDGSFRRRAKKLLEGLGQ